MKNILVTGAAGFIGFHLAKQFLKNGANVTGIDNLNDYMMWISSRQGCLSSRNMTIFGS